MSDPDASIISPPALTRSRSGPPWRTVLAPDAQPRLGRSLIDLGTSVVPYLGLLVAMHWLLLVSVWLVLVVSVPAAGFLLRTYIVFHDCAHSSFLPWRKANARSARRAGTWSSPRFSAGAISVRYITLLRAISTGVGAGMS